MIRYGISWRAMPNDLPPWSAAYQQPRHWMEAGCFDALVSDCVLCCVSLLVVGRSQRQPFSTAGHNLRRRKAVPAPDMMGSGSKKDQGCTWPVGTLRLLLTLHVTPASRDDHAETLYNYFKL
ncbi:transposase [Komagataeibacter melaceti]|uniref:transposase n=1 Tax=Komagataeibacter melaceti TaxID=2766577 RepID=UPI001F4DD039|nr:transposase [Komagataeibacter melaceti]